MRKGQVQRVLGVMVVGCRHIPVRWVWMMMLMLGWVCRGRVFNAVKWVSWGHRFGQCVYGHLTPFVVAFVGVSDGVSPVQGHRASEAEHEGRRSCLGLSAPAL